MVNLKFKLVNFKYLIFSSILCKIVIYILITLFNLNTSLVCIGLYLLLSYGFLKSNKKGIYVFKLLFIIQFWIIFSILFYNETISFTLNILILKFFYYYEMEELFSLNSYFRALGNPNSEDMDMQAPTASIYENNFCNFSSLDNSNSKHIFDAIHNILKSIDFNKFVKSKGGDPSPNLDSFRYLFLNTNHDVKCPFSELWVMYYEPEILDILNLSPNLKTSDITSEDLDNLNKKIIKHNDDVLPCIDINLPSLNKLLSQNFDIKFSSSLGGFLDFWVDPITHEPKYWDDIYYELISSIVRNANNYNYLQACKLYFESEDKASLPENFKELWNIWYLSQLRFFTSYLSTSDFYMPNFSDPLVSYHELNDSILIIGVNLLAGVYIYENILPKCDPDMDKVEVRDLAYSYYEEFVQKYYPFYHHFSWQTKLFWNKLWFMGEDNKIFSPNMDMNKEKLQYGYPKFKLSSFSSNKGLGKLYYEFNFKDYFQGKTLDNNVYKFTNSEATKVLNCNSVWSISSGSGGGAEIFKVIGQYTSYNKCIIFNKPCGEIYFQNNIKL